MSESANARHETPPGAEKVWKAWGKLWTVYNAVLFVEGLCGLCALQALNAYATHENTTNSLPSHVLLFPQPWPTILVFGVAAKLFFLTGPLAELVIRRLRTRPSRHTAHRVRHNPLIAVLPDSLPGRASVDPPLRLSAIAVAGDV